MCKKFRLDLCSENADSPAKLIDGNSTDFLERMFYLIWKSKPVWSESKDLFLKLTVDDGRTFFSYKENKKEGFKELMELYSSFKV